MRSTSQKRRVADRSPVSINMQYELSLRNTRQLWQDFESHLRSSIRKDRVIGSSPATTTTFPKAHRLVSASIDHQQAQRQSISPPRSAKRQNRLLPNLEFSMNSIPNYKERLEAVYQNHEKNRSTSSGTRGGTDKNRILQGLTPYLFFTEK